MLIQRAILVAVVVVGIIPYVATAAVATSTSFVFPSTPAGELAKAYIESLNSGDAEHVERFTSENRSASALAKRPLSARVEQTLQMHAQMGELVPALVTEETDSSLTLTVHAEKLNMWLSCKFALDNGESPKLDSITFMPTSPPDMELGEAPQWETLQDLLETLQNESGIPALGAAVVEDGKIVDRAVTGVRQIDSDVSVKLEDRFHIGSVTKSMTATMIGGLVENGTIEWDVTVGDVLGSMKMHEAYRGATLEQLLQHRAGFPPYADISDEDESRLSSLPGSPTDQRGAFVAEALLSDPVGSVGGDMSYSNAGYVVAAYMAERISGKGWEALMDEIVLDPLGMRNAGEGWPATEAHPNQPRGHFSEGSTFRAQGLDEYPLGHFLSPAGNLNASIEDLARYAQMHLAGLAGKDDVLAAATIARLHTTPNVDDDIGYALGWVIKKTENGTIHYHAGSAGTFYAVVELYPEQQRAIVCVMNVGPDGAAVADAISKQVNERHTNKP